MRASLARAAALRAIGLDRGDVVALIVRRRGAVSDDALRRVDRRPRAGVACIRRPRTTDLPRYLEATAGILRSARARADRRRARRSSSAMEELRGRCPDLAVVMPSDFADSVVDMSGAGSPSLHPAASVDLARSTDCRQRSADEPDDSRSRTTIAFVQFTSGSTSRPKGIAITHRSLAANIDAINGPAGLASSRHGFRGELAAALSRHGTGGDGARRAVLRPARGSDDAGDVRQAAGRVAAGDFATSRDHQLRARTSPTTCACAG